MSESLSHPNQEIYLIRHGETEWSLDGRHTSRTDLPLTDRGSERAGVLGDALKSIHFDLVLTSPSLRARDTARIAGYGQWAQVEPDLREWDYGAYEGHKTADIQKEIQNWSVWTSPILDGESIDQVAARANEVIKRVLAVKGRVAIFSHAHFLRILAACWIESPPLTAQHFVLETGSISILGFERTNRAIVKWNVTPMIVESRV